MNEVILFFTAVSVIAAVANLLFANHFYKKYASLQEYKVEHLKKEIDQLTEEKLFFRRKYESASRQQFNNKMRQ